VDLFGVSQAKFLMWEKIDIPFFQLYDQKVSPPLQKTLLKK
jgi:hypothetical protein